MKKLLLLSILFSPLHGYTQSIPTDTEVFDFNVGDVFQYYDYRDISPYRDTYYHLILSKSFNSDSTQVNYHIAESKLIVYTDPITFNTQYIYSKDTLYHSYPRLDEPIDSFILRHVAFPLDTSFGGQHQFSFNTVNTACDSNARIFQQLTSTFEGEFLEVAYSRGLGLVDYHYIDGTNPHTGTPQHFLYLRAHIKNGSRCGTLRSTEPLSTLELNRSKEVAVYPNPTSGLLYFKDPLPEGNVMVSDLGGRSILSAPVVNETLDLTALEPGVYVLIFELKGGERCVRRVVVE